ncbi:MAG: aldose epimerase family protein [Anaerolineae bacterium]
MKIKKAPFGTLQDGTDVSLYTLVNDAGMRAAITPYGGTIVELTAPDREGEMGDVVLGFDSLEDYVERSPFFGCLVGRYANRIAHGTFTLEGVTYELATNDGQNHLHGGLRGFDKQVWEAIARESDAGPALELSTTSPDGEEGYPGTLSVNVLYTLTDDNALRIDYTATTDKTTVVNLTNHTYFNLSAGEAKTVLDHVLVINADTFTPVDETLIPTGEVRSVAGTPLDFRTPTPIGARIDDEDEQLGYGGGYDHNWVINGEPGELRMAARVTEPESGRVMEVLTTEPGVQVYTANMMPPSLEGKGGRVYGRRSAICLETQHFPDSPNKPTFPSTVLRPDGVFRSTTVYRFSTTDRQV